MANVDETPPLAAGQIEIWKKIIDVQQHFNDLELRIRNFALIVTGAFLGLGGYAIKDGGMINAWGFQVSMAGLVVFSAVVPLLAFYFMDRLWYHRLLDGSVEAGIEAENALTALGYKVNLGSEDFSKKPVRPMDVRYENPFEIQDGHFLLDAGNGLADRRWLPRLWHPTSATIR